VHQVGFYYTAVSRCMVNKTLKKKIPFSKIHLMTLHQQPWHTWVCHRTAGHVTLFWCHKNLL